MNWSLKKNNEKLSLGNFNGTSESYPCFFTKEMRKRESTR
jgi:hypothetical protein